VEVSGQLYTLAALHQARNQLLIELEAGWAPTACTDVLEKRKLSYSCRDISIDINL
jgi:hypothetical protein